MAETTLGLISTVKRRVRILVEDIEVAAGDLEISPACRDGRVYVDEPQVCLALRDMLADLAEQLTREYGRKADSRPEGGESASSGRETVHVGDVGLT